ncbi:Aldo/keto reductase [Tistlia consotensis]|uniref:Aldo/keto reductase n=1 Tax=Tistlia consotensis USBA 355 TaxID=560819 RepID=A0A1Y6BQ94_9PROT|nr:aldo/keto reductase [Tistlia consotensis]SMF23483.1 Aldo/keto reductase [Tistlia consotensis USBA 355]SNR61594.1 Aldo/keto reductase [Tistlia consotensis]
MIEIRTRGARLPALGFGTWDLRGDNCRQMIPVALELGYRHIDTAQSYGNEAAVGQGLRDAGLARDALWITSKLWPDDLAPERVPGALAESLERLGTDYLDLLLIHWPSQTVSHLETLAAMEEQRQAGRLRHLGVSNFTVAQVAEASAAGFELLTDQVEYHPLLSQDDLRDALAACDMVLTAYAPLARGRVAAEPTIRGIAERHGKTPEQVALRWLVQQRNVAAIPKAGSRPHAAANIAIFDFVLEPGEMAAIAGLGRQRQRLVDPSWAPAWDAA